MRALVIAALLAGCPLPEPRTLYVMRSASPPAR